MAEVECPTCEGDVEVPNVSGHYTCPLCDAEFEFESQGFSNDEGEVGKINPILYFVGVMAIAMILNFLASVLGLDQPGFGP